MKMNNISSFLENFGWFFVYAILFYFPTFMSFFFIIIYYDLNICITSIWKCVDEINELL